MKKIWLMLLMVCTTLAFTACSDDDNDAEPVCPVTGVSVPKTAEIGTEISVSGTGFAATAKLYLTNAAGVKTEVKKVEFSASGATLTVPMGLTEGNYTLVLSQNGEWDLGKIELTAASLPVLGLELPAEGWIGKKMTLGGSGFNTTSQLFVETESGSRTELSVTDRTSGLVCKVPENVEAGVYKLILAQDGGEWVLSETFHIVAAPVIKRVVEVKMIGSLEIDYTNLSQVFASLSPDNLAELGVSTEEELKEVLEFYVSMFSGEQSETFEYDTKGLKNVKDTEGQITYSFTYTDNEIKGENMTYDPEYGGIRSFTLTLENGQVIHSTADYGKRTGEFDWKYNEDGYWQSVNYTSNPDKTYSVYNFKNGNMVSIGEGASDAFTYDEADWKNNIYGIDVALYLISAVGDVDDDQHYAAFLGLTGKRSANVPSSIAMYEEVVIPLTYTWDHDGYVESVTMNEDSMDPIGLGLPAKSSTTYEFVYEVVDYE